MVGPGSASERFGSGSPSITMTASVAVLAGRLVEMTGSRTIGPAGAASIKVVGVAKQDCDAVAATGNKIAYQPGGGWLLTATGAITAGDPLIAGANGTVSVAGAAPDARTLVGKALETFGNGTQGLCQLNLGG